MLIRRAIRVACLMAGVLALLPTAGLAQGESTGQITGVVRDSSGGVLPGVVVEAASPALIEKVRSTTTDNDGRYRITNLPVGTYSVSFALDGFSRQQRNEVLLTSGLTLGIDSTMAVGQQTETIIVTAESDPVDVQNARQAITFQGDEIQELPTARNVSSLLALTPGITSGCAPGTGSGICSGGIGVFCNPGVPGFNVGDRDSDRAPGGFNANCPGGLFGAAPGSSSSGCDGSATNLNQGRVMVDGAVINSGSSVVIGGLTQGFVADIANAQEVTIQLSGALGESETGGASINIVPRTGGNRFAGNYNTTYTRQSWFATNGQEYSTLDGFSENINSVLHDYDVSGAFGGPILRDRLWFYSVVRQQGKKAFPACCGDFYPNAVAGEWGFNYLPDLSQPSVTYENRYRNANARLTLQASQRNKFNIFWDEQDSCQDPCYGVVSTFTSPESWWSVQNVPNRLQQVSWTNPLTNRILLEAGLSVTAQHYDTTRSRDFVNPQHIPAITEFDNAANRSAGMVVVDGTPVFLNSNPGTFGLTSGSLNSGAGGGSELRNTDNYRPRASVSYVTGSHNAKIGYEGGYYTRKQTNNPNDLRLGYTYFAPGNTCVPGAATNNCGNTAIVNGVAQFPDEPFNQFRRPRPFSATFNTGPVTFDEYVNFTAFYVQDQWTVNRLTVNAALRYDHATSGYNETCVGGNGSEPWVPVQIGGQYDGQRFYCTPDTDGVKYNDITPRWGVAYDLFGNGRTSVKWNMGKYLDAASLSGIYAAANPARRTVNTLGRTWTDLDADRIVDCDPLLNASQPECPLFGSISAQYGRDPLSLDESGNPVDLATTQCGRREQGIPAAVQAYCDQYGESLLDGWGRRQSNWQLGLGIQHEILPRLSGEVTYNRRSYQNLQVSDQIGVGCDRFETAVGGQTPFLDCAQGYLNFTNPTYDFYTVAAPEDPDLPLDGGYRVVGLNAVDRDNVTGTALNSNPRAVTYIESLNYAYNGVDTNFVWRGPGGLRVNGGTSTGRSKRDTCLAEVDGPNVRGRLSNNDVSNIGGDADYVPQCAAAAPFQTRVNGSAAYTVPWVDVLVSTVFQSFPGIRRSANMSFSKEDVIWNPESADRAGLPCVTAANGVGCVGSGNDSTTTTVNLLSQHELYGDRVNSFDLKLAKNLRFGNKRATLGVDVYNFLNSSGITDYQDNFTPDNPATPDVDESAAWGTPQGIIAPRFARLSVQFYF